MSWQDELQQLDSALASGQISADEYRIRRDRAIAQASGQSAGPAPQGPVGEATQVVRPVQPPTPGGDRTQIVPGAQGPGDGSDRTQVVPGHDPSSDNTQVVPGGTAAGHNPQFPPPPPPPPWETGQPQQHPQQHQPMAPPPWGGEDALPPEFGQQSWPTQGPEVFEESGSGSSGRIIAIVVAAILILGGGGAAVWYFGFNKKDDGGDDKKNAQTTEQKTNPTEDPKPDNLPDGPFIELPGKVAYSGTKDREKAIAERSPSEQDVKVIQNSDVESVSGLVTGEAEETRRGIWAFKSADPTAVLTAMDTLYQEAGFQLTDEDGVLIRSLPASANNPYTTFRAHYVVDGYMVRIECYGKDANDVTQAFEKLKSDMTKEFPPEK